MKKKLLLFVALCFSSASAVSWQYAQFTSILGPQRYYWSTPERIEGGDLPQLLQKMGCNERERGLYGMLNCAGRQGWELVTIQNRMTAQGASQTNYIFKRQVP